MKTMTWVVGILCFQLSAVLANTCSRGCSCTEEDDGSGGVIVTKQEGLATAIGAMTPLVIGGAGLILYNVLKGRAPTPSVAGGSGSKPASPSLRPAGGRGSFDSSYKNSPQPYQGARRGSAPVSIFGENDEITFDDSLRSPRPETSSTYTNIHRPNKDDAVNRWM